MRPIRWSLLGVLLVPALAWWLGNGLWPQPLTYFSFRGDYLQFSGVLAIAAMSVALVLALRLRWIERPLHGLDKVYRLHRWLGIAALLFALLHWLLARGTQWAVGWGWLQRPQRRAGGGEAAGAIEAWLRGQRGLAETLGEWAFYAMLVLIVLALLRRIPYRGFAKTHWLLAPAYLLLAYHALVLLRFEAWRQPVGVLTGLLLATGSVAALYALAGRIGARRRVGGVVETLDHHPEMAVLETGLRLDPGWPGHEAGQFAFVTSEAGEGAHPYTIASAWRPDDPRLRFITKALGDHTAHLHERLRPGMRVQVEGPYGAFTFEDAPTRQIWIGAGIGITPFVARMKRLAQATDGRRIDLYHTTREIDAVVRGKLAEDVAAAGVRLHLWIDGSDGLLDGARIRAELPDFAEASVWFCGPVAFADAIRRDLVAHGLPPARFHQELFQMR